MSFDDQWWSSLTPDEQDMLMSQAMGGSTATSFNPTTASPGGFDFSYPDTTMDFTPTSEGSDIQPSVAGFTTKGKINNSDRAQVAGKVNLLQDMGSLSVDNILSGYGGAGSYDPNAFTPTYEFGSPVNLPGRRKAESLAQSGGWQAFVSDQILNKGLSPAQAEEALYEYVNAPDDPKLDQNSKDLKASVLASMGPLKQEGPAGLSIGGQGSTKKLGDSTYNTDTVRAFTTNVWSDLMNDPDVAYTDPQTGLSYSKTPEEAMKKTPQMLAYDKFGIPYPTATYEDPDYIKQFASAEGGQSFDDILASSADYQKTLGGYDKYVAGLNTQAQASGKAADDLDKMMAAYRGGAHTAPTGAAPGNPYGLDKDSLEAANKAAELDYQNFRKTGSEIPGKTKGTAAYIQAEDEKRKSFIDAAMKRAANAKGIQTEGTTPFAITDQAGNAVPFTFGGKDQQPLSTRVYSQTKGPNGQLTQTKPSGGSRPYHVADDTVSGQRQRANDAVARRSQAANAAFQATYRDPINAVAAAIGRAYVLSRSGQTPFRDAMASRNANAARMLYG